MNKNKLKGAWQKAKGKIKEELGHATRNTELEQEGVTDQIRGRVNTSLGRAKDAVKDASGR